MSAGAWLKELGAVRPMEAAGINTLVLGDWHAGYYPIRWTQGRRGEPDCWWLFGVETKEQLDKDTVSRIMRAITIERMP